VALLVDTSAWVEFLRGTGSSVNLRLRAALEGDVEVATTDVILMEILAGARDDGEREELRALLYGCSFLAVDGPGDYEQAAEIYRVCRRGGETVRKLTDCLIAAVAIRSSAELLQLDSDFPAIARHAPLRLAEG
jgi:predicted nucleic acid-binding protein